MLVWLVLQAAVVGPVLDQRQPPVRPCASGAAAGEVVVCGRAVDQEAFRLRALPERYDENPAALPKAETSILGGRAKLAAEAEQAGVGGFVSNRGMVRLKIPLGK